jgi:hypothetical protein
VLQIAPDGRGIARVGDYDLTTVLADDERICGSITRACDGAPIDGQTVTM